MTKTSTPIIGIILIILLVLCCCCIFMLSASGLSLVTIVEDVDVSGPVAEWNPFEPTPTVVVERPPVEEVVVDTYTLLRNIEVPENNLYDLACRLQGRCNIPAAMQPPAAPRVVGETDTFWVINVTRNQPFQVDATLRYVSDRLYLWVEDGIRYDEGELTDLGDAFENHIYPTTREFFGSEWTPGIDGDPRIYILYARGLGFSIAGYYAATDEYHLLAQEYSNAHEMFVFNADNTFLSEEYTYGVLAHEFQHMIHWNIDRNEASWLNEGLSELSALINGYYQGGFDRYYISDPDLQLNDWPNNKMATASHYGSGFLFTNYFLNRFGKAVTQALVANPLNGLESMDDVLAGQDIVDPLTGLPVTADDFFLDWAIANYLQDPSVADGRYAYPNYPGAPKASATETISNCPASSMLRTVHQYGVDYIQFTCPGEYTLSFTGATVASLLPVDFYSGSHAFWSNKGDESNMTLTRQFDFSDISGPVTLAYRTWYDIEADYDYVYLEISTDGRQWQIITTPSGTADDPSGNSYGWAYNGFSAAWIGEQVDLSQYAGQRVWLRFEYVTDAAINGEGFLLDDVSIPEVAYFSDFEQDDGGWEASGFARVENSLPQTFRLALLTRTGDGFTVDMIPLTPDQTAEIAIHMSDDVQEVVLVVTGTTRFTRQPASYEIEIR